MHEVSGMRHTSFLRYGIAVMARAGRRRSVSGEQVHSRLPHAPLTQQWHACSRVILRARAT